MKSYQHVHQTALFFAGYLLQMAATDGSPVNFRVTRGERGALREIGRYGSTVTDRERFIFDLVRDFKAHGLEDEVHIESEYDPREPAPAVIFNMAVDRTGMAVAARVLFEEGRPAAP